MFHCTTYPGNENNICYYFQIFNENGEKFTYWCDELKNIGKSCLYKYIIYEDNNYYLIDGKDEKHIPSISIEDEKFKYYEEVLKWCEKCNYTLEDELIYK